MFERMGTLPGHLGPGAGPCTSRSAGPGPGSWQPRSCDYGRYRSRPDARSQRRPGSEARASMPAHASRSPAPAPSAPPSRALSLRHRPTNAGTPAERSGSPGSPPRHASIGGFEVKDGKMRNARAPAAPSRDFVPAEWIPDTERATAAVARPSTCCPRGAATNGGLQSKRCALR